MGGHAAGEVASMLAVETIEDFFDQKDKNGKVDAAEPCVDVKDSIDTANRRIHNDAKVNPSREGMGATCVLGLLRENKLYLGHVGDSRAYLVRGGGIRQLTRDHSFVEEMVKAGMITPHETHTNPQRNVILQSLGRSDSVNVEVSPEAVLLKSGDYVLLCSDGLTAVVADQEIAESVTNHGEPEEICDFLVELTNQRGAPDNVTVAIIRFDGMLTEGPRIALFCDDEESHDLYKLVLGRDGFQVAVASDAHFSEDADPPKLVIVDQKGQGNKALALTQEIRSASATSGIPVLLVNHGDFTQEQGHQAGASHILGANSLLTDLTPTSRHLVEASTPIIHLLQEDSGRVADLVGSLRDAGFLVFTHTSSEALLKAAEQMAPKLVILDITHKVEHICQDMKTSLSTSKCPLVLSAQGAVASPREAFQLGADYYLTQSEQVAQLAAMLLDE
jgi:protein phosphatase